MAGNLTLIERPKPSETENRNRIQCLQCLDIIESVHVHNYVSCQCQACFVDGGNKYQRWGGHIENILLMPTDDNTINHKKTLAFRQEIDINKQKDAKRLKKQKVIISIDSNTHSDTDSDTHSDTDSDTHSDTDSDTHSDTNSH